MRFTARARGAVLLSMALITGGLGQLWAVAAPTPNPGSVFGWGLNTVGEVGDASFTNRTSPVSANSLTGVSQVSAGAFHSLALAPSSPFGPEVWAWGDDSFGQLGDGVAGGGSNIPQKVTFPAGPCSSSVIAVAAGGTHSLALSDDGTICSWGYDASGQLGDGTIGSPLANPLPSVVSLPPGARVVAIAAGDDFSLALRSDGSVLAWGQDAYGQVGDNVVATDSPNPTQVSAAVLNDPLEQVVAIAAGRRHALAVLADGKVRTWGDDTAGQLGDGTPTAPVALAADLQATLTFSKPAVAVAGGGAHSLALLSDGTVWSWGSNSDGQLGRVPIDVTDAATPAATSALGRPATAVAAGSAHSLAIVNDGTVRAWGNDNPGELGDGDPQADSVTPVTVFGLTGVISVDGGGEHSLAAANLPLADLSIGKGASAYNVNVGDNITFTSTVTNNGPHTSATSTLTDDLPGALTFVSASPNCSGPPVGSSGPVTCTLPPLAVGASTAVSIVAKAQTAGQFTNTAAVNVAPQPGFVISIGSGSNFTGPSDPNNNNNIAQSIVNVGGPVVSGGPPGPAGPPGPPGPKGPPGKDSHKHKHHHKHKKDDKPKKDDKGKKDDKHKKAKKH